VTSRCTPFCAHAVGNRPVQDRHRSAETWRSCAWQLWHLPALSSDEWARERGPGEVGGRVCERLGKPERREAKESLRQGTTRGQTSALGHRLVSRQVERLQLTQTPGQGGRPRRSRTNRLPAARSGRFPLQRCWRQRRSRRIAVSSPPGRLEILSVGPMRCEASTHVLGIIQHQLVGLPSSVERQVVRRLKARTHWEPESCLPHPP